MQTTSRADALLERSKHHREHGAKRPMKSPNRIGKDIGMLFDRRGR
jgi:hypothetical protein